jgi:hypothetical protein
MISYVTNDGLKVEPAPSAEDSKIYTGVDMDDASLVKRIKERESSCKSYYDELWKVSEIARKYYVSHQVDDAELYQGETRVVENRFFLSLETIVPIATRRDPEPIVTVTPRSKRGGQLKGKLQRYLFQDLWKIELEMPEKLRHAIRSLALNRYAVFKYYFDPDKKEIETKLCNRGTVMFPKEASTIKDAAFIIEFVTERLGDIIAKFPDKKDELRQSVGAGNTDVSDDTQVTYIEYWEDELVVWKYRDVLLGKARNPNFNYTDHTFNYHYHPQKPYEELNFLSFGDGIADPTSLFEQVRTLQDNVNKRKRQIELNARLANGKIVTSGDFMEKETFAKISNDPAEMIYLEHGDPRMGIAYLQSRAYDPGIYQDMIHSESAIDNIMGTHSTTRGEKSGSNTATGQTMLKESDMGRLDLLMRNVENLSQRLYGDMIQLMYVFYNEQHPILSLPETSNIFDMTESDKENYLTNKEFKKKRIRVRVDSGSITPQDRSSQRAEAIQLYQLGALSTKDLMKILEYANPEEMAKNAVMEKANPAIIYPLTQDGEAFDVDAIKHILALQNGVDISQPDQLLQSQDPSQLEKHIRTHRDYVRGIEIDEDLIPFSELGSLTIEVLVNHIKQENDMLNQLALMQQQMQSTMQPQVPQGTPQDMPSRGVTAQGVPPQGQGNPNMVNRAIGNTVNPSNKQLATMGIPQGSNPILQ